MQETIEYQAQWYAVQTQPNREFVADSALRTTPGIETYLPILRRPFIGRQEMAAEVAEAARAAFYQFRVHRTAAGTGLVIYLSLYERQVQILGDESLDDLLSQAEWDELRDLVVNGLREGHGADGLIATIRRCGDLLAARIPVSAGDRNELHNELQFIE